MKVTADLCVIPLLVSGSLAREVAVCERILRDAGLSPRLHGHGTNVEGELAAVLEATRTCIETLHARGIARVNTRLVIGSRTDKEASVQGKIDRVEAELSEDAERPPTGA
jgi:uncharacterized protein (TIGR00106 family)